LGVLVCCESYFGTGTLFCLCELVEDGDDEGGVKTGEYCGRTGLEVSTSPEWPLVSTSVTRPGGVDEPLRAGERNIGGRGVSAACAAYRRKLQEEKPEKGGNRKSACEFCQDRPFLSLFRVPSQPLWLLGPPKRETHSHVVGATKKKYLKIEKN
jgi:hypothetical protein